MANTYTQLHIQVVFSVKNRLSLINSEWQERLYKYIIAIIQKQDNKVLAIGGTADHIHILLGLMPSSTLSKLIQEVKRDSSAWINNNRLVMGHFSWQTGYGAFSYSKSQVPKVIQYIMTQKEHHKKKSFIDEYKKMLQDVDLDYDDKYIFKSIQ